MGLTEHQRGIPSFAPLHAHSLEMPMAGPTRRPICRGDTQVHSLRTSLMCQLSGP